VVDSTALESDPAAALVAWRRDLHRHPELGFLEFRTSARVAAALESWGFDVQEGPDVLDPSARMGLPTAQDLDEAWERVAPDERREAARGGFTALVATLHGDRPGRTVAVRADMDALPITESNATHRPAAEGFASEHAGVMHACGHDAHIAMLLDVARRLRHRTFAGTLKLIVQPAEEGLRGARAMALAGAVDDVDDLLCLHIGMGVPTGTVYADTIGAFASTKLRVRFDGAAAHAAMAPERGRNALLAASSAALALHSLPQHGSAGVRLNVGYLRADGATNVVAARAVLGLELRANHVEAHADLRRRVDRVLSGCGHAYEVDVTVETVGEAPAVVCDEGLAAEVAAAISAVPGIEAVGRGLADHGSDDAAWLMNRTREHGGRSTYLVIGSNGTDGHHENTFDIDERSLQIGAAALEHAVRQLGAARPTATHAAS
jgi:aminobenzoyl-glutamate utilization protein A